MMPLMQTPARRVFILFFFLLGILLSVARPPAVPVPDPRLSAQREQHILYGDRTGGGHLHGVGKACKSEFPADWDAAKVIAAIKSVAANDNVRWRREQNGYHVTDRRVGDVIVRVVVDGEKDDIITGYPTNLPRNPCPARGRDDP